MEKKNMEKNVDKMNMETILTHLEGGKMDIVKFQKMIFFYNALHNGWTITQKNDTYVFEKKHKGKKEIFDDTYLSKFMKTNLDIGSLLEER
jgi:hypothetical protein